MVRTNSLLFETARKFCFSMYTRILMHWVVNQVNQSSVIHSNRCGVRIRDTRKDDIDIVRVRVCRTSTVVCNFLRGAGNTLIFFVMPCFRYSGRLEGLSGIQTSRKTHQQSHS